MCLGMNPDVVPAGERCASTSNRNFEGRQGRGARTHLVSPEMAAAAALHGHFVDVQEAGGDGMKPFVRETGRVAIIDRPDVDTDQIVPKQFLKRVSREGFGEALFYDWRYDEDGRRAPRASSSTDPSSPAPGCSLAGRNFGCGSSREHADLGAAGLRLRRRHRPSFGDIFRSNASKVGLVIISLPDDEVKRLMESVNLDTGSEVTVDLERQVVVAPDGREMPFAFDETTRHKLLNGLDDIALTLQHEDEIAAYEAAHGTA